MPICFELTGKYRKMLLTGPLREFIINKAKKPLMKALIVLAKDYPKHKKFLERAIIVLANRFPEPTRENCLHPNTHKLFDIEDKFFKHFVFENESERKVFEAIWKLYKAEYEHDPYYRFRHDWGIEYSIEMGWDSELPIEHKLNILIVTRDKFFEYEAKTSRTPLFEAAFKLLIAEYKDDPNHCIDWILEEINKSNWLPRSGRPMNCWKEKRPERTTKVLLMPLKAWSEKMKMEEL